MSFVQDMNYDLLLSTHAETMLAWRYGIQGSEVDVGVRLEVFFKKEIGQRTRHTEGIEAIFAAGNARKVRLIVDFESMRVVTALPNDQVFQTPDASVISYMLDAIRAIDRQLLSVDEIIEWRNSYIEANGGLCKDDLRRELRSKAPNFSPTDPFQALGIEPSFFDEVATLRDAVFWTTEYLHHYDASNGLPPDSVDGIVELYGLGDKEVFALGYSERTRTSLEIQWDDELAEIEAEYAARGETRETCTAEDFFAAIDAADERTAEEKEAEASRELVMRRLRAKRGVPSGAVQVARHPDGTSTLMLDRISVFATEPPPAGEPWYRLYYAHQDQGYFVDSRFGELVDAYDIGDTRLYVRDCGNALFVEKPPS